MWRWILDVGHPAETVQYAEEKCVELRGLEMRGCSLQLTKWFACLTLFSYKQTKNLSKLETKIKRTGFKRSDFPEGTQLMCR